MITLNDEFQSMTFSMFFIKSVVVLVAVVAAIVVVVVVVAIAVAVVVEWKLNCKTGRSVVKFFMTRFSFISDKRGGKSVQVKLFLTPPPLFK
jgi:hypothetical protein